MNELSLFTGAGGGLLASNLLGFRHVGYCDFDKHCRESIAARIKDGFIEEAPIFDNVKTLDLKEITEQIHVVSGGFPCQPFSQAGKRRAEDDDRNQWPNTLRILVASGADLGFFENVPGLASTGYLGEVLGSLAQNGFDAEWQVLGADDVGAPHQRKRLWILAHRHGSEQRVRRNAVGTAADPATWDPEIHVPAGCSQVPGEGEDLSDTGLQRLQGSELEPEGELGSRTGSSGEVPDPKVFGRKRSGMPWHGGAQPDDRGLWWDRDPADMGDADEHRHEGRQLDTPRGEDQRSTEAPSGGTSEPRLGGLADGLARWLGAYGTTSTGQLDRVAPPVPLRTVRVRQLGNGQVPLTAAVAFLILYHRAMGGS